MVLPNFLLLGAPKSGTTALYQYLHNHPQIFMSAVKEPHFFAFENQDTNFNGPRDERGSLTQLSVTHLSDYEALFATAAEVPRRGEASTMYLYWPGTAQRIAHYVPEAKLVAILRNPVDRAFSHYLHLRRSGREWLTDFVAALDAEPERIAQGWSPAWHYGQVGQYAAQIEQYWQIFPREQLKIFLYEEWNEKPAQFWQELLQFLEIDATIPLEQKARYNTTPQVQKNVKIHDFLTQENPLKSLLRKLIPAHIRQPLAAKAYRANVDTPPKLTPELRDRVLPRFREGILRTQDCLQRDLSAWLTVSSPMQST